MKRSEMGSLSSKQTAAVIRKLLRASFPATKFSVVTERGSMVSSVRVAWTDGPSVKSVKAITGQFEAGRFDGMTDSYDYDRDTFIEVDGEMFTPGCNYVFEERTISAAFANRVIPQIAAYWGVEAPTATADGWRGGYVLPEKTHWATVRPDLEGNGCTAHYSWGACIGRATEDATAFAR